MDVALEEEHHLACDILTHDTRVVRGATEDRLAYLIGYVIQFDRDVLMR